MDACVHFARAAWAAAPLQPLTPHEARHTCASYLSTAGLNPKQVQVFIGHSSVKTTLDVFAHLVPGDEATAAAKLDVLRDPVRHIALQLSLLSGRSQAVPQRSERR